MTFASRLFHLQKRSHSRLLSTTHQLPKASYSSSPPSPCLQHAGIPHLRRSIVASSPSRRQRGVHYRGIVTSSVAPSHDVFIERPEVMVLAESSLYKHSWEAYSESFYPSHGLHFASVDIMKPMQKSSSSGLYTNKNTLPATSLESLQQTMTKDLSHLGEVDDDLYVPGHAPPTSTSAHAVLIARGPIQCLIAQYFLESLPLAGLVLVDPLLLPVDGRAGKKEIESEEGITRWNTSLLDLISMLESRSPQMYNNSAQSSSLDGDNHPPLQLPSGMTIQSSDDIKQYDSTVEEISLLHALTKDEKYKNNARSLKLEHGSIPVLVMYSGDHTYDDYYRVCSERTAAFHTCGGEGDYFDQVSVLKIPKKSDGDDLVDDLDQVMGSIYEWYDEVVA